MTPERAQREQNIRDAVCQIPAGRVASYGDVAKLAGLPRGAREVGRVLRELPDGSDVPWHRVVNSKGDIRLALDSPAGRTQRDRLRAEGVVVDRGRISMNTYAWRVDADLLVWGLPPR